MITHSILRLISVIKVTGYSRSTIYNRIKEGAFPKPVSLGPQSVGWPSHEIDAINAARISGRSSLEIKALVTELEQERKNILSMHRINSRTTNTEHHAL